MKKIFEIIKDRKFKFIVFFWSIIGIQFVMGSNLQRTGYLFIEVFDIFISILKIILLSAIFIILHYLILELLKRIPKVEKEKKIEFKKYRWLKYFLIIFICWVPTVLALYPCNISYDGGYQIMEYFFKQNVQHHPVLITKLYSTFYAFGVIIENPTFGMFLYSLFQMTFMASIFSYTVKFIEDEIQQKWIRNISILFYALYPYNQILAVTTTKDVIFSGLMLIFVIYLYRMIIKKYKISDYVFFIIIGIMMLLSRNNAIYTLKLALPFLMLILIKDKYKLLKVFITFIIIIVIYPKINTNLYVSEGSKTDEGDLRISTFSQAVGKVVRDKENELTQEEKEKISYYFNDYKLLGKTYQINIADNTVEIANSVNINKNKKEFFEFIIELGKKYPIIYIESFLNTTRGYWYIEDKSFSEIQRFKHPGAIEIYGFKIAKGEYEIKYESKIPELKNWYFNMFCLNRYQEYPIIYIIYQPALYFYMTFAFLLYSIYKKNENILVIAIFLFIFFASCYLAHCSIIRYMYPVMVSMPFIMMLIVKNNKEENKNIE